MTETLYPHEQIIKILNAPNSVLDSVIWLLVGYAMLIIQVFCIYGMVSINKLNNLPAWYFPDNICWGFNVCGFLTLILVCMGIIGLGQSLSRVFK